MIENLGKFFFRFRSYTPIPLLVAVIFLGKPSIFSYLAGSAIVIIGEFIRILSVRDAGESTRSLEVVGDRLAVKGLYSFCRNPIYLGNFILSLGFCIMAWSWMPWMLILFVILFWVQYFSIIRMEENFLLDKFGEEYVLYKKKVPAFFPRFNPSSISKVIKNSNPSISIKAVLENEKRTFQSIIIIFILIGLRGWLRANYRF